MKESKLVELIRTFSSREWKSFLEFVRAPYFNKNEDVTRLCELIYHTQPDFETLDRRRVYGALFPGGVYQDAALNHLMSFLLKLGEQFIGLLEWENAPSVNGYFVLKGLSSRGLDKHYRLKYEKTISLAESNPVWSAQNLLEMYWVENLEADRKQMSSARGFNEHIQRSSDSLDYFYLAEKLRFTCYMLTSQKVVAMPYKLQLVEEVCRFVQERDLPDHLPVIRAYYRVYCLFAQEDAFPDFIELKKLIIHYESFFERMILDELYQYAINYCNLQIMKNPEIYVPEALNLYIMAIESGLMVNNGYLSPWNFKNVIKLSLILKQYDQTEQLILKYSQLLDPAFREDALHYNLAELFYHTERYDSAMSHLNQVEFTDVHYNLGAKVMLAKIYQHEGAYDALESLLHAFRSYLNRNKVIANDVRRIYLNFIYWLTRIIRSADGRRDGLREKIEQTKLLTEKNWLISLIAK